VAARDLFHQRIKDGTCKWYGKGKEHAADFSYYAREAWYNGQRLSTEASRRKIELCLLNNAAAQPSAVRVPATSTSLLNKGKSRQESSLSEESPLENGPHSKNFLDTAKSSQPSTSDSNSYLLNEPQLSSSLQVPPLYSEADGAISVNLEDDTEDDSNDMCQEEVGYVYNLLPEERCPWASIVSFNDKLRAITGQ